MGRPTDTCYPQPTLNSLFKINWIDVQMLTVSPETGTIHVRVTGRELESFQFGSTEEMEKALFEWMGASRNGSPVEADKPRQR